MVCRYKATIEGNKIFMREYEIKENTTLYVLHIYLQNDLGFAPDQMVMFRGLDKTNKVKGEYGLFDLGDGSMDRVTLGKTLSKGEIKLQYVYDLYSDRFLILEYLSEEEELARRSYPRLTAERGKNPDQFSDNYDDFEQMMEFNDLSEPSRDDELQD
jgi:hypothetical protein